MMSEWEKACLRMNRQNEHISIKCRESFDDFMRDIAKRHIGKGDMLSEFVCKKHGVFLAQENICPLCQRESEEQIEKERISALGIPLRFLNESFETFIPHEPAQKSALSFLRDKNKKGNAIISGGFGTGKTHLCFSAVRAYGADYYAAYDLFRGIRLSKDETKIIEHVSNCKLLIIDELGRTKMSVWEMNTLFEIVNNRYNNMIHTIFATNFGKNEFMMPEWEAIIERMSPVFFEFTGKSLRK